MVGQVFQKKIAYIFMMCGLVNLGYRLEKKIEDSEEDGSDNDQQLHMQESNDLVVGDLYQLTYVSDSAGYCVDLRVGGLWLTKNSPVENPGQNHIIDWLYPGDVLVPLKVVPWTSQSSQGPMVDVMILTSRGISWILALRKDIISHTFLRLTSE